MSDQRAIVPGMKVHFFAGACNEAVITSVAKEEVMDGSVDTVDHRIDLMVQGRAVTNAPIEFPHIVSNAPEAVAPTDGTWHFVDRCKPAGSRWVRG